MEIVAGMRFRFAVTITNQRKILRTRYRTIRNRVMAKATLDHEMAGAVKPVAAFW